MTRTIWTPTLAWLGAAAAALLLALAGPTESIVMGQLPALTLTSNRPDHQPLVLSAERTLVLVAFSRSHRGEVQSWVDGLGLDQGSSIAWLKMPVLNDPGSAAARNQIENNLLARQPAGSHRARLVPVFTNREAFIRAAGLSSAEHASVLVLNREGKVLARAQGRFDQDKAYALRETLLAQGD